MRTWLMLLLLLMVLPGCPDLRRQLMAERRTPSHYTRLWPEGQERAQPQVGISTEDGIVTLTGPSFEVGDRFEIEFPIGNSYVVDTGRIVRLNEHMAVLEPFTSRLDQGRFAAYSPAPDEPIWLNIRDERDQPIMVEVSLWDGGEWGDWVLMRGHPADSTAHDHAGAGLYVRREERWEICGVLSGLTARAEDDGETALGFLGLAELGRLIPGRVKFFDRGLMPHRPDFDHGDPITPRDIQPSGDDP